MVPRPLPEAARRLCEGLAAPPRLVAHLALVHDAALELVDALESRFPDLAIDRDAVLFGAATHDLGKVIHPAELSGPGNLHEADGPPLLERQGLSPTLARFARTHGEWRHESDLAVEDLLVALADSAWKGQRNTELEARLAARIARCSGAQDWEIYLALDEINEATASRAEDRLAWQGRFG